MKHSINKSKLNGGPYNGMYFPQSNAGTVAFKVGAHHGYYKYDNSCNLRWINLNPELKRRYYKQNVAGGISHHYSVLCRSSEEGMKIIHRRSIFKYPTKEVEPDFREFEDFEIYDHYLLLEELK